MQRAPKTAAGKRAIKKRDDFQVNEPAKTALFLKGTSSSAIANSLMKDLYLMKKPDSVLFAKKNDIRPFEDTLPLEFFAQKNNAPLMVFSHHSKKRPDCLVFIRFFDNKVMDMVELHVKDYKGFDEFMGVPKVSTGSRPLMTFSGIEFDMDMGLKIFKNMMIDMYRGDPSISEISLKGIEHVMAFSTAPNPESPDHPLIVLHVYKVTLEKSNDPTIPRVELHEEMGPACVFKVGRIQEALPDVWKHAIKVPKEMKDKKTKNVEFSAIGDKLGRVHMHRQDFEKLQTRKVRALKRTREVSNEEDAETAEA